MYSYIKGIVEEIEKDYIVIENSGIGYKINVSSNTIKNLSISQNAKIYTKLIVREDDMYLCGFYSKEEMNMFELLTSISKIGPKIGISILSNITPKEMNGYILNSDINKISKLPGIGKKTAERIVLELKDKVDKTNVYYEENLIETNNLNSTIEDFDEAIEALISLGYSKQEAVEAISKCDKKLSVEEKIKKSLSYIMNKSR